MLAEQFPLIVDTNWAFYNILWSY